MDAISMPLPKCAVSRRQERRDNAEG